MTYNLHPIFVHFPIAMLFVYSIIKIFPFKKWLPSIGWRDIERVLLIVGVLGAFVALATGDAAEHLMRPNRQLVNAHATFAGLATWIYGALLAGEFAAIINTWNITYKKELAWIGTILRFAERILCDKKFSLILALVGFIAISITGMLGGIISYGVSADPIAPVLLNILGINLG